MGWREAQRRYKRKETLADQSTEEKVARRVLRGLGLVQKDLPGVERRLFGNADFDEAIWPRTLKVWKQLDPVWHRRHDVEVLKLDARRGHAEILERLEEFDPDNQVKPMFLTIADTVKVGWAYTPVSVDQRIGDIKPPFKVITETNHHYLLLLEIESYLAGLGPYELGLCNDD